MKFYKLFSVLALSLMTLTVSAAITSKATIKVVSSYLAADYLYLYEDDAESDSTADVLNTLNAASVNMYAVINEVNYSSVKRASLSNLKLVFKANSLEDEYKITFSDVVGDIILVSDGDTITAVSGDTATFTCTKSTTREFTVNPAAPVYPRTVTASKFGTICLPWASTALEGAEFYSIASYKSGESITLAQVTELEAGVPYIYYTTATEIKVTYDPATEVEEAGEGNGIYGTFEAITLEAGKHFVYDNKIYESDGTVSCPANYAYLDLTKVTSAPTAPGRKLITIPLGQGVTTGIEGIEVQAGLQKMMINGQLIIIKDGKMFNAQGAAL